MTNRFTKKQVFFDLDDTLVDEGYKFEMIFCECLRFIILGFETRAPQIDEILQRARSIDNKMLEEIPPHEKYLPKRLINTWVTCYRELCQERGRTPKPHIEQLLTAMIIQTYDPPYFVIPDVVEVLNELVRYGRYELHLMTAGAADIQQRKLDSTDLGKYFSTIHFLPDGDKAKVLREAVEQFDKDFIASIGNSIRTDINPALELGVKAIYIPRGTWNYMKVDPFNNDYITLDSISKVPEILDGWAKDMER
ncbi:MAG: HAD family hydrolase [Candidatus Andersenbacteria bacterium]|nr:HAD family hydrolase [Candidatus Andersenbacteria bacterium]MBI3250433.1 HAD family hydrolase [Candidatus Andersenbacteria bacterium]